MNHTIFAWERGLLVSATALRYDAVEIDYVRRYIMAIARAADLSRGTFALDWEYSGVWRCHCDRPSSPAPSRPCALVWAWGQKPWSWRFWMAIMPFTKWKRLAERGMIDLLQRLAIASLHDYRLGHILDALFAANLPTRSLALLPSKRWRSMHPDALAASGHHDDCALRGL